MRVLDEKMLTAIDYGSTKDVGGNVFVEKTARGWTVKHHRTIIAERVNDDFYFAHGGWVTSTTATRLRALADHFNLGHVQRKLGTMYCGNTVINGTLTRVSEK